MNNTNFGVDSVTKKLQALNVTAFEHRPHNKKNGSKCFQRQFKKQFKIKIRVLHCVTNKVDMK